MGTRRPVPTTFTTRAQTPTNRFSPVTTPQFSAVTTSTGSPFKAVVDFAASPSSPAAPVEQAPIITTTFRTAVGQESPAAVPATSFIPVSETATGNGKPDKVKAGEDYYYDDEEEIPEGEDPQ